MSNLNTSAEAVTEGNVIPEASTEGATQTEPVSDKPLNETPTIEVKPEEPKAEEKKPDRFAPKFAALTRQEKALRQSKVELKAKEAELEKRTKEIEAQAQTYQARQKLKKENPLKFLEEEGVTYDELTQMILNNGEVPAEKKQEQVLAVMQEEIKALREELKQKDKKEQEEREAAEKSQAEQKYNQQIDGFKAEIKEFLDKSDVEAFELMKSGVFSEVTDPIQAVYDVVLEHYEDTKAKSPKGVGEILDIKDAADMVEQWLESEADKIAKTKKIAKKLNPPVEEKKQSKAQSESPSTLENAHSSTVPSRQGEKLDDDALLAQAASIIRWNKN